MARPPLPIRAVFLNRGGIRGSESIGRRYAEPTRGLTHRRNANDPPKDSEGNAPQDERSPAGGRGSPETQERSISRVLAASRRPLGIPQIQGGRGERPSGITDARERPRESRAPLRATSWGYRFALTGTSYVGILRRGHLGGRGSAISKHRILSAGAPSCKPLAPCSEPFFRESRLLGFPK